MNALAKELNDTLMGTVAYDLLSDYGKRMYFPKGIIAQSAEAKQKAHRYNATIGIATANGSAMHMPSVKALFSSNLIPDDVFPYAPTAGEMPLRHAWLQDMFVKNPSMKDKSVSLPVVTSGLTHSISIAASLFLEKDQTIIVPDLYWGNYNLIFNEQREAKIAKFALFSGQSLNLEGLEQTIDSIEQDRVAMILNFPNNPTGYTPTETEAKALVAMLKKKADSGKKLLVFTDDAYFGLFFEPNVCRESLFALLCDAHENIFAIKGDAATKEEMVWGFRIGFLTYGAKGLQQTHYEALIKKTMGAIRGSVSSCSKPAQSILYKAISNSSFNTEKQAGVEIIAQRYHKMKAALKRFEHHAVLKPLPFNSGYFMAFACTVDAEQLRQYLLDTYQVGTISVQNTYLRLAFSSIDLHQVDDLITIVYQAAEELSKAEEKKQN